MLRRHDRARGGVHERAAAPAGRSRRRSRAHWNAAQAIAGVQLAIGANSPFFFGRELWRETRIALFEQATDTRPEELKAQGVRPRVWFGERWITSIFDLFEENVRYFPALLPVVEDEDPVEVLERGGAPRLQELRLHNGTIYRWNRPIYDVVARPPAPARGEPRAAGRPDGRRHARQRRLLLRARARAGRGRPPDLVADVVLGAPRRTSTRARATGIDARVYWPGVGEVPAAELVLRRLLPMAHDGLDALGRRRRRRATACSGSSSAAASSGATAPPGRRRRSTASTRRLDRADALREMTVRYREHMHSNEPVHTWPLPER